MIKFFRKIRYDLMEKNKTVKYIKYAIGEIILVIIGILIALQINNLNEQHKKNEEEKLFLSALIDNLNQDIDEFELLIERDSLSIVASRILLSAFKNDSIRNDKSILMSNIIKSTFASDFNPHQTIFNQIKSSAKLNYIRNDSIKYQIQEYYDSNASLVKAENANNKIIIDSGISNLQYIDFNSVIQSFIPEYARSVLNNFDNSFFYKDLQSEEVKDFVTKTTLKQVLLLSKNFSRKENLQKGIRLRQNILEYLDQL